MLGGRVFCPIGANQRIILQNVGFLVGYGMHVIKSPQKVTFGSNSEGFTDVQDYCMNLHVGTQGSQRARTPDQANDTMIEQASWIFMTLRVQYF